MVVCIILIGTRAQIVSTVYRKPKYRSLHVRGILTEVLNRLVLWTYAGKIAR